MGSITLSSVSKEFPTPSGEPLRVLKDVSFTVGDGTFSAILGPSGCGRSTILNLISGLDRQTSGEILIDGHVLQRGANAAKIGFVFQRPLLLDWRTVVENVLLPLERNGQDTATNKKRVGDYLDLMGLGGFEDYYPLGLSGGMQQRVAIARALAIEPDILLMDEPFSGLDELTARVMREELIRIWRETGKTIVFVTHSIRESVFLSQQILIVSNKPATILKSVDIDMPYPREYGDEQLFRMERDLTRDFLEMNADTFGK